MFTGKDACATTARMRWNGQIFWLLAFEEVESLWLRDESQSQAFPPLSTLNTQLSTGLHLLPAFTPESVRGLAQWEVVSSYSSATAPDSHGISCAGPLFSSSQRTGSRSSGLRFIFQDLFINPQLAILCVFN
jgi:hypothetical protein